MINYQTLNYDLTVGGVLLSLALISWVAAAIVWLFRK